MTEKPPRSANRIVSTLRELISALDRRVPHAERPGELRIARDAQLLRRQAVAQIKALNLQGSDDQRYDQELVDAIMTDDGCPRARRTWDPVDPWQPLSEAVGSRFAIAERP